MTTGPFSGLDKYDEAHHGWKSSAKAGLLTATEDHRPAPPAPETDGLEKFFQIYWSKGNNPVATSCGCLKWRKTTLVQLHVSLAHQYWGHTYMKAAMNRAYVEIMDDDTRLKEKLDLQACSCWKGI
ncbi:MAG: hypothetical protein KF747_01225 [Nitrospira sp.]|nr:hypothetical protein [Nitrospira sp.]